MIVWFPTSPLSPPLPLPMYILLSSQRTRLYKDPIEVLASYTSTPHGSLDVLDECIPVLGEVISGVYHQLPGYLDFDSTTYPCWEDHRDYYHQYLHSNHGIKKGTYGSRKRNWSPTITPPKFNTLKSAWSRKAERRAYRFPIFPENVPMLSALSPLIFDKREDVQTDIPW